MKFTTILLWAMLAQAGAPVPTDPQYPQQLNLKQIRCPDAWALTVGSRSVGVGIIGSGIATKPETVANLAGGWNTVSSTFDISDVDGHETLCAGVIGATWNNGIGIAGICREVALVGIKTSDTMGTGSAGTIAAITWALENRERYNIRVLNASYGGGANVPEVEGLIKKAGEAGMLIVCAAGNDRRDNDHFPFFPASYRVDNVISVAAVDPNDKLWAGSNFGATSVHVAAPGVNILSTNQWSVRASTGTSMAAPHVSGAAALCFAYRPKATPAQVRSAILAGADVIPALKGKVSTGGRLNVKNALDELAKVVPQ